MVTQLPFLRAVSELKAPLLYKTHKSPSYYVRLYNLVWVWWPLSSATPGPSWGYFKSRFSRDLVDFWQEVPTKWLQERPNGSKNDYDIPPRRASRGSPDIRGRFRLGSSEIDNMCTRILQMVRVSKSPVAANIYVYVYIYMYIYRRPNRLVTLRTV
jgi:hypothetical protein